MEDKKYNPEKFEIGDDSTKYGEFISSYFEWITPEEQKRKASELQNITKNKEKTRLSEKNEENENKHY